MNSAGRIDVALLIGLTPIWIVCVFLHSRLVIDDRLAWLPVYIEATDEGAEVTGLWPGVTAEEVGVAAGDVLSRVGDVPLANTSRIGFLHAIYNQADGSQVPIMIRTDEGIRDGTLTLRRIRYPWRTLPVVFGAGALGLVMLLRIRRARAARSWALAGIAYSFHWALLFAYPGWQSVFGLPFFLGGATLFPPLVVRACLKTPDTVAHPSRLTLALPWLLAINGPATAGWLLGAPFNGERSLQIVLAVNLIVAVACGTALTRNFLRSDAVGRRQIKWVLLGVLVLAVPVAFTGLLATIDPSLWWLYEVALIASAITPVCIFIAFVRDNFLDVNRLLSVTATYTVLSVLGLSILFSVIPYLSTWVSSGTNIGQGEVQTLLSVVMAAILIPTERIVRPRIERLIFRERRALEEGIRELSVELARASDPDALYQTLGERLTELLRLDACAVYAARGEALVPVYVHGAGVPPGFATAGGLAQSAAESGQPVGIGTLRRWARKGRIDEAESAALDALGTTVLFPIAREETLAAMVCLGEKESGDVFSAGDLALLQSVADRLSFGLLRFDQAEMDRVTLERQEALTRYVPGAVAEELGQGNTLSDGAREVSVLFVDIRGYTGFAEERAPEEIFDAVNRYTQAVSTVVKEHGGSVVDFQGDGLFAVFGAPRELPDKERAAVAAGLDILGTMETLRLGGAGEAPLEAGVGIATGEAYVGNIQAVDRQIWGVIGNTTNLAARLQGLTRDLDAAIVIDTVTRDRAGAAANRFERRTEVRVKGRSHGFDLWTFPREL